MVRLRRRTVDVDIEKKIITGMIVSTEYCKGVFPLFRYEHFTVGYAKRVARWVHDYYVEYNEAPGKHIEDIFNTEKEKISDEESSIINVFLQQLSSRYEQEEVFNSEYLLDQTVDYFRRRALIVVSANIKGLLGTGRLGEAEEQIHSYKKIAREVSTWVAPLDDLDYMDRVIENAMVPLFSFPGQLGDLIGPFCRGWLVGFMGPMKRGKCLAGNSKILLSNGVVKSIEDLFKESGRVLSVVSLNDHKKLSSNNVERVICNGKKVVYLLKTRTGREIEVTEKHPFLTVSGWREFKDLSVGDFIAVPKILSFFGSCLWPEWKVRVLAYLLAEGSLVGNSFTFTNGSSLIRSDFESCINMFGDKIVWGDKDLRTGRIVKREMLNKGDNRPSLVKKWFKDIGGKICLSKFKEIPNELFRLNKDCIKLFLSVLFECDGSIWKDKDRVLIDYSSASKTLTYQVFHLLLRFGIVGKVKENRHKEFRSWEIIIQDKENLLRFLNEIDFMFEKKEKSNVFRFEVEKVKTGRGFIDVFPPEFSDFVKVRLDKYRTENGRQNRKWWKRKCLSSLEQSIRCRNNLTRNAVSDMANILSDDLLIEWVNSDILWDKIILIERKGKQKVYDLSIRNNHNFVANDLIVHNSIWLQELAIRAIQARLKVVFISLEMGDKSISMRIYRRLTAKGDRSGFFIYPCFDCAKNQDGSCSRKERKNNEPLLDEEGERPEYDPAMTYRPCVACKNKKQSDFVPDVWFTSYEKGAMSFGGITKVAKSFVRMYGKNNLRIKAFPAYSANLSDVMRALDNLEFTEDFVPDVIIIDYADILAPEDSRLSGRDRIDETWKKLKGLAARRHCLVVTASQSSRASIEKKSVSQIDTAEDIRKLAHVDLMLSLNQTKEEKRRKYMRIGILAHRHVEFDEGIHAMVLQQLSLGQTDLGSEIMRG